MQAPEIVTLVYLAYLAAVSLVTGRARVRVLGAALAGAAVVLAVGQLRVGPPEWLAAVRAGLPLVLLLVGYRAAGLLYVRPDMRLEQRLLAIDHRLFDRAALVVSAGAAGDRAGTAVIRWLEVAYLGVYLIIPLGAVVVVLVGPWEALERFWTVVLVSGFACYGALPWIQTRPPRAIEPPPPGSTGTASIPAVRRLNLAILDRGSVGVNTLPSGHAATAVATALAVAWVAPAAGVLFGVAAIFIAAATVSGRYHYTVDTVLGVLVGCAGWLAVVSL